MPRSLRELLWFQRGVLSRQQALANGLSADAVKSRVRYGRWQRLHNGVYTVFTGPLPRQSLLWAAVLRAGPGAMLSYQTAAELSGLVDEPSTLIHVTIPHDRRLSRIPGHVTHVSARAGLARHPSLAPPRTQIWLSWPLRSTRPAAG
jgi:predicted transcriptional regulator of viral defense system